MPPFTLTLGGHTQHAGFLRLPPAPQSVPRPPMGFFVRLGDLMPCRVIHDNWNAIYNYQSRTLKDSISLRITNEMYPPSPWYYNSDYDEWRVKSGKIKYWPEHLPLEWEAYFFSEMTPWQIGKFNRHGFGWRDGSANADTLNPFSLIFTGGQLLTPTGEYWRGWYVFETQDTSLPPEYSDYESAPHHWFKQYNVGHTPEKQSFWQVDKGEIGGVGDLYIPNACPGGKAAISQFNIRQVPKLPLRTNIDGWPVTFVEYCFTGSDTYGMDERGDWYPIEKMLITGDANDKTLGGSFHDHRLYIEPESWRVPKPAAVIGWKRE